MKKTIIFIITVMLLLTGCSNINKKEKQEMNDMSYFTKDTKVIDVINNKSFENFGNLIFPVDRTIDKNMTLETCDDLYIWYNYMNTDKTVEIVNYMKEQIDSGNQIFYSIYTEEEIKVGNEDSKPNKDGKKSLVVYFSVPETDDPNKKMTTEEENSAIVVDGKVLGNTQYAAKWIAENTGGDLYRIEPKTPYTTNHRDLVDLAKEKQNKDVHPEIKKIQNAEEKKKNI